MDDDMTYDEQLSIDELGRSGNDVIPAQEDGLQRDTPGADKENPVHFDIPEVNEDGSVDVYHVIDEQQTWLPDF